MIKQLPPPPDPGDRLTWAARCTAFFEALVEMTAEINALGTPGLGGGKLLAALDLAAAVAVPVGTPDIGAAASNLVDLTGDGDVTAFPAAPAGTMRWVKHCGAQALHHGGDLLLRGGADRTAHDGDLSCFISEGDGVWRQWFFFAATGDGPSPRNAVFQPTLSDPAGVTSTALKMFGLGSQITPFEPRYTGKVKARIQGWAKGSYLGEAYLIARFGTGTPPPANGADQGSGAGAAMCQFSHTLIGFRQRFEAYAEFDMALGVDHWVDLAGMIQAGASGTLDIGGLNVLLEEVTE